MKLRISLIIILTLNSIAYSQITSIPTDAKKEIIKTLLDYPLVIQELNIEKQKNTVLKSVVNDERHKESIYKALISNKDLEILNLEQQKKEYEKQIKRSNSGLFLYANTPLNNFTSPEVGLMFQFKNKFGVMGGVQVNTITNTTDWKVGALIKIF